MAEKTIKTLTAIERGGLEDRVIAVEFEVPGNSFDLETALECAVEDYAKTSEGRDMILSNGGMFNLADIESSLPNSFCEAHGFSKVHTVYDEDPILWDRNFMTREIDDEAWLEEELTSAGIRKDLIDAICGYEGLMEDTGLSINQIIEMAKEEAFISILMKHCIFGSTVYGSPADMAAALTAVHKTLWDINRGEGESDEYYGRKLIAASQSGKTENMLAFQFKDGSVFVAELDQNDE